MSVLQDVNEILMRISALESSESGMTDEEYEVAATEIFRRLGEMEGFVMILRIMALLGHTGAQGALVALAQTIEADS